MCAAKWLTLMKYFYLRNQTAICFVALLFNACPFVLAEKPDTAVKRTGSVGRPLTSMPAYPKGSEEYLDKWDPFVIEPLTGTTETMSLLNGRQIARDSRGTWFVLLEKDGKSLLLGVARGERVTGGDFEMIEFTGSSNEAVFKTQGHVVGASLVIDSADVMHVVWCDAGALLYAKRGIKDVSAKALSRGDVWGKPTRLAEPTCEPGDIMLDISGKPVVCYTRDDTVFYLSLSPGAKEEAAGGVGAGMPALIDPNTADRVLQVVDPAAPAAPDAKKASWPPPLPIAERRAQEAVMDLGPDGAVHLAFRRDFDIWYVHRTPEGKWQAPELAARGLTLHPSIICADQKPLICFQLKGMKTATLGADDYISKREGGGSSIGFAVRSQDGWRTDCLSKEEEIIVNRQGIWDKRFEGKLLPMIEQSWRPVLFRDRHGVPWVLWQNTTRRWAYCARWLGEGFGEVHECRGPFNAPGQPVSAEKHMPAGATDVGLLFFAANRVIFDRLKIPTLSLVEDREIMFLDCLEVAALSNVDLVVNQMTKHPGNPILSPGPLGSKDDRDAYAAIVHKHGNTYVMRYGYKSWAESDWKWGALAISDDGVHFKKVEELPANLPPANTDGKPETPLERGYFDNPDQTAPGKKYMRITSIGPVWHQGSKKVQYSSDGQTWTDGPEVSVLNALYEGAGPNLWDTLDIPERRIKAYGRIFTTNSRSLGMMWTSDLVHWYGAEHFLDPDEPYAKPPGTTSIGPLRGQVFLDACAGKNEDQIYSASISIVHGLYFTIYWPCSSVHRYEAALAVSRDGFNFTRVKNGSRTLPVGPAGAWDSGAIRWDEPLFDGELVREYYGGGAWHHGTEPYCPPRQIGLATIRMNGWTYYAPSPERFYGTLTTIPIQAPTNMNRALTVNIEGITKDKDAFAAEILDGTTGDPLPGFTVSQCKPVVGDGLTVPIEWTSAKTLPTGRPIRIRFHIRGKNTRLYSFAFKEL